MTASTLTKIVSIEFLVGMCLQAAVLLAVGYAWKATTTQDIEMLKVKSVIAAQDHDAIIRLETNVLSIKETVARIELSVGNKKEASNGN